MNRPLHARIAALEAELDSLKREVAAEPDLPLTSDRRGIVKLLAAGAVGAVTGAAALGAKPAAAVDGNNVVLGSPNNTATHATVITTSLEHALVLDGGTNGYGVVSDGDIGNAWFQGSGLDPLGGPGDKGALWVDGGGNWWAATADGGDGLWRKIAGPATAGQLHILPAPVRVYDSRANQPPQVGNKTRLPGNTPRTVDMTLAGSNVPATANAVMITLTIAAPGGPGFASVWPTGPYPGTSNINFTTNQNIATTTVSGCGPAATIQVLSNVPTDFLVDVIGYYQ